MFVRFFAASNQCNRPDLLENKMVKLMSVYVRLLVDFDPRNACNLVPTVFRWHEKMKFKFRLHYSSSHDTEKQI